MKIRALIGIAFMTLPCSAKDVVMPEEKREAPLFGRDEHINFDVNVSGAKGSTHHHAGANGGRVEVHMADPLAELSAKDFVNAPILDRQNIVLDGSTDLFRCAGVRHGSTITVAGKVRIECKGMFNGKIKGDFRKGTVHLTLVLNGPEGTGAPHMLQANLTPDETEQTHRDGGTLIVHTSAVGGYVPGFGEGTYITANGGDASESRDLQTESTQGGDGGEIWVAGPHFSAWSISASGGNGRLGSTNFEEAANGGDGGRISIHAQVFSCGGLHAKGGNGGSGNRQFNNGSPYWLFAGDGGKGGLVCVLAETIVRCGAQVCGGDGGDVTYSQMLAGAGGDAGTIYVEASQWWDSKKRHIALFANGGMAGNSVIRPEHTSTDKVQVTPPNVNTAESSAIGKHGGKGGTIVVQHRVQSLHRYPYDRDSAESLAPIQALFSAFPSGMEMPYGRYNNQFVTFASSGGMGGHGSGGLSFIDSDQVLAAGNGGGGGPGGVVTVPSEWISGGMPGIELGGGGGGVGGEGPWGRAGRRPNFDGGPGGNGGDGGSGGQPGLLNGRPHGKGGDGGSGGEGGYGGGPSSPGHRQGKGGDGGRGGDAGGPDAKPGQGGKGGSSGTGDKQPGVDGQAGGSGGAAPEEQEVWAEVMPFSTPASIALDYNRDGEISFGSDDRPTQEKPFIFWINDDRDVRAIKTWPQPYGLPPVVEVIADKDEPAQPGSASNADESGISSPRDLEDFTRLWVQGSGGADKNGVQIQYRLSMESLEGSPAMNVFMAENEDGNLDYLTNEEAALRQIEGTNGREHSRVSNTGKSKPLPIRKDGEQPRWCLIFEGAGAGLAALTVETLKDGNPVAKSEPLYLRLLKTQDMYEIWSAGESSVPGVNPGIYPNTVSSPINGISSEAIPSDETPDYFLFVHGWNMSEFSKETFANTAFKRLWHQGFKGRFGVFRWPTFYIDGDGAWAAIKDMWNYDASEHNAWLSGEHLAGLVHQLAALRQEDRGMRVHLYAHSMGNVVAGESLRHLGAHSRDVRTYIAAQAAISAHAWDSSVGTRFAIYAPQGEDDVPPNILGHYWEKNALSPPGQWEKEGRFSYFHRSYMPQPGVTHYINHCNPRDFALNKWQTNQYFRPAEGYSYFRGADEGFRFEGRSLTFPNDRYEIFAFASESHSNALGQEPAVRGAFESTVNLSQEPFRFGKGPLDHSAQFNYTIQERWDYWRQVMKDIGAKPIEP